MRFTKEIRRLRELEIGENSRLLVGQAIDERGTWWEGSYDRLLVVKAGDARETEIFDELNSASHLVSLRSYQDLKDAFSVMLPEGPTLYFDLTTLSHRIWAPILKVAKQEGISCQAIYAEPTEYGSSITNGEVRFNLSERISGIKPIPGYSMLDAEFDRNNLFVPLLGFEGPRLQYILTKLEPDSKKIFPVIGVPGFRVEFPDITISQNAEILSSWSCLRNVRGVSASCPFALIDLLGKISETDPDAGIQIALVGTKPHALGAILFHLVSGKRVEIIYDHPVRKPGRSHGILRILQYDLDSFFEARQLRV